MARRRSNALTQHHFLVYFLSNSNGSVARAVYTYLRCKKTCVVHSIHATNVPDGPSYWDARAQAPELCEQHPRHLRRHSSIQGPTTYATARADPCAASHPRSAPARDPGPRSDDTHVVTVHISHHDALTCRQGARRQHSRRFYLRRDHSDRQTGRRAAGVGQQPQARRKKLLY